MERPRSESWRRVGRQEKFSILVLTKKRDAPRASASLHCSVVSVVGNGYWVGFDKHGGSAGYHSETRIAGWINIATAGTS